MIHLHQKQCSACSGLDAELFLRANGLIRYRSMTEHLRGRFTKQIKFTGQKKDFYGVWRMLYIGFIRMR